MGKTRFERILAEQKKKIAGKNAEHITEPVIKLGKFLFKLMLRYRWRNIMYYINNVLRILHKYAVISILFDRARHQR